MQPQINVITFRKDTFLPSTRVLKKISLSLGTKNYSSLFLTIWLLKTCIYVYRTANLQTLQFKYLLNKYTY
jgi:hypothetical protein